MVQNFIKFITGNIVNKDEGSIRDINRMQLEVEKAMIERELSNISERMIRGI